MKKYKFLAVIIVALSVVSCDLLDRPQMNLPSDEFYWQSEANLRLFANEFYPQFFVGYSSGWGVDYTPVRGNVFNDDVVQVGPQIFFDNQVPETLGSGANTTGAPAWRQTWAGPTWYFGWIRKANLMVNRIESNMSDILSEEAYNHWIAVARFFKALDYCRLVSVFGDVPYFERYFHPVVDRELMYKDRTPRNEVMDAVYDEFRWVLENLRANDGHAQRLNRHIAAGFISRWMLFEGTWQKYHNNDVERAAKFLKFSVEASEILIESGRYRIATPFRELFGSQSLSVNPEMILFRSYDAAQGVMHHIASYNNTQESQAQSANLALVKAFICHDGDVWQNSGVTNAEKFDLQNLIRTRDPRFEATFWNRLAPNAASMLYTVKFIDRIAPTLGAAGLTAALNPQYVSNTNTNDAPVVRYGEILLNWIEAKAELETLGTGSVSQTDIDISINALRARPLDAVAVSNGAQQTAAMQLSTLPNDPARDADVPVLIWEIRRERRMELYSELPRLLDLKRWRKIDYMRGADNPDILRGIWIDFPNELPPAFFTHARHNVTRVMKDDGTIVVYTRVYDEDTGEFISDNRADLVGFFLPNNVADRQSFTNNVYLSPVGLDQINLYSSQGFTLTQTPGW